MLKPLEKKRNEMKQQIIFIIRNYLTKNVNCGNNVFIYVCCWTCICPLLSCSKFVFSFDFDRLRPVQSRSVAVSQQFLSRSRCQWVSGIEVLSLETPQKEMLSPKDKRGSGHLNLSPLLSPAYAG